MKGKHSFCYFLFCLLCQICAVSVSTSVYAASVVKGNIDGITKVGDSYYARGWACQTGRTQSIEVRLFAGGSAGTGTMFTRGTANNSSETGVASACGSTGKNYRFNMLIPNSAIATYGGKKLYIHGISLIGSGNSQLNKSGTYALTTSKVIGKIESITKSGENYYAKGWACQKRFSTSIGVHLYVGGAAGTGTYIGNGTANQTSEAAIAGACDTSGRKNRFSIVIPQSAISTHGGKSLYVHGISSIGTGNLTIENSGLLNIPADVSKIEYEYDALGRLTGVKQGTDITTYSYDDAGNRKSVTKDN